MNFLKRLSYISNVLLPGKPLDQANQIGIDIKQCVRQVTTTHQCHYPAGARFSTAVQRAAVLLKLNLKVDGVCRRMEPGHSPVVHNSGKHLWQQFSVTRDNGHYCATCEHWGYSAGLYPQFSCNRVRGR